jgi:hypothetical protein
MRSTARLFIIAILFLPPVLLISGRLAHWLMWTILLLFVATVANSVRLNWREEPARRARIAAILAGKPAYIVYGSGVPAWIAVPIYVVFIVGAFALIIWEGIFGPATLRGVTGFLTVMMMSCAVPFATLAAAAVFRALAWRLRSRFPDEVVLFANDQGIGTSDGFVIPYARIRRIDPCSWRSKFGTDNWIEIDDGVARKVHLNMVREPLDDILTQLRDHARAGGADLRPAFANGQVPNTGTQLGYRMGYLEGE